MIEFTKSEKRELRRLAGDAYKAELEKEVAKLEAAFKKMARGQAQRFRLRRADPCVLFGSTQATLWFLPNAKST